jgi:hypothetical protein
MAESLTLKWGTVKGWDDLTEQSQAIMRRYFADGVPGSAMADHPDAERRAILCELIDQLDGEIWDDWNGGTLSKDAAKEYVTGYGSHS